MDTREKTILTVIMKAAYVCLVRIETARKITISKLPLLMNHLQRFRECELEGIHLLPEIQSPDSLTTDNSSMRKGY